MPHWNRVVVMFTDEQLEKLYMICQDKGWTLNRTVRSLVQDALDEFGPYTTKEAP